MGKGLLFLAVFCCLIGVTGCSARRAADKNAMTDVVIIQNTVESTGAPEDEERAGTKAEALSLSPANGYTYGFEADADYDIKNFIRQYYDYMVDGEYELAAYMTNDSSRFSREVFMERSGYMEAVKSLTCYMMEGMVEGTYIVVAECGVLTTLSDNIVTMLEAFYICTNESGTIYIYGSSVGDEIRSYNSIMLSDQMMSEVVAEAARVNEELIAAHEELAQLEGIIIPDGMFRYLYEQPTAEQSPEEGTGAENTVEESAAAESGGDESNAGQ